MTTTEWHLDDVAVNRYTTGEAGPVERHSIESHVIFCGGCRTLVNVASRTGSARAERWNRIATAIDRPTRLERALPDLARATWASPILTTVTVTVVAVLMLLVALASLVESKATFVGLLALAPVVPIGLVIVAFRPTYDPAGSLADVTPVAGGRLQLVRSLVCSVIAIAASTLSGAIFPLPSPLFAAWFLPAVAFAAVMIAVSSWFDPVYAGAVLAVGWWISIGTWIRTTRRTPVDATLDRLIWTDSSLQRTLLVVAVAAAVTAWVRRNARPGWRAA